jgi:HAD superfamily hydrolase (TIGR01459 family)
MPSSSSPSPSAPTPPRFVDHLRDLVADTQIILSDIWGVLHNGRENWPAACEALQNFRKSGGTVVLITNAPRPAASVQRQLQRLDVADDVYDAIVSSGDLTRGYITGHAGKTAFHLGPDRDSSLFKGLDVTFAPVESADYIVATSPFNDDEETPEDYRDMLTAAAARKLPMICANPDIVVERGDKLVYCAGALAELYITLGGSVVFGGKPHRPIYEQAMQLAKKARGSLDGAKILAIGDSVRTDLEGANAFGLPCLFVTAGIHAGDLGARDNPDPDAMAKLFREASKPPFAVTSHLRW